MKILLVCSTRSHVVTSQIAALLNLGHDVSVFDLNRPARPQVSLPSDTLFTNMVGPPVSSSERSDTFSLRDAIEGAVSSVRPDIVLSTWGSECWPSLQALSALKPRVPVVHQQLCYPTEITRLPFRVLLIKNRLRALLRRKRLEVDARAIGLADIRLWSSIDALVQAKRDLELRRGEDVVLPEFLSRDLGIQSPEVKRSSQDGRIHGVFLGLTSIGFDDQVWCELNELAKQGIVMHVASLFANRSRRSTEFVSGNANIRVYESDHELANYRAHTRFVNRFDFVYHTYGCRRLIPWAMNSITTRAKTALLAGTPLVLKSGYYKTIEGLVLSHGVGLSLYDLSDATQMLERRLQVIQARAWNLRWLFTAEESWGNFFDYLDWR